MLEAGVLADLLRHAADSPQGVRFVHGARRDVRVAYAALLDRARRLLGYFQQRGLRPGDALLLFVRNNRAFVDAFWACQLGGLIPVPLSASAQAASLGKLAAIAGRFEAAWLFSERLLYQRLRQGYPDVRLPEQRVCLVDDLQDMAANGVVHPTRPGDIALIQFSSGSTSEPKGVQLTHANLLANIGAISRGAGIVAGDITLSWMPLSHDMGLIGFHLVPLFNRLEQVLMDTDLFIRRPALWLETAAAQDATLLCSPNFGYQHYLNCVAAPAAELDLGKVRLLFNGAEPVSARVCRDFLQRLASRGLRADSLFPVYGLAEASLAVAFPAPGSGLRTLQVAAERLAVGDTVMTGAQLSGAVELVCLGQALDSCELRIADEQGRALPELALGHVQIRGASVTSGYYRCPECDREALVDGWLDSGDLGFINKAELVITGRSKELFFAAGQNWYPQDVERLLEQAGAVSHGRVAVTAVRSQDNAEDRVLVCVQHRGSLEDFLAVAAGVQAALAGSSGLCAQAVVPLQRLPRTTSGKLQRYRLAAAWEQGEYRQVLDELAALAQLKQASAAASATEQQLLELCRARFPGRHVQVDQNLFELGADSLTLVGLHEDIDTRFPGKVEITDLFDHPTIRALAAYIDSCD
jgi:acyl-CoA synthetase (AMP-forming)/AMP-acid ligase II/aryl carrier-like protein